MAARTDFEESFCGTFWKSIHRILSLCTVTLLVFMAGGVTSLVVEEQVEGQTWVWAHSVQVAALVAPATVTLMQVWGRTSVLSLGCVLAVLGMTVPLLMPPGRAQGVTFSLGFGAGLSVMFQVSTLTAVDRLHRWRSLLLIVLTVVSMVTATPLLKMLNTNCSKPVLLTILVCVSVLHLILSLAGMLLVRCCFTAKEHKERVRQSFLASDEQIISNVNQDTRWYCMSHKGRQEELDPNTPPVLGSQNREVNADNSKWDLLSAIGTLVLWGTGIQLVVSADTDTSARLKLAWVCLISCLTLAVRLLTTHFSKKTPSLAFTEDNACILLTVVLGMGAIFSLHYPRTVDPKSFLFLFALSFSHQLKFHEHFNMRRKDSSEVSPEKKNAVDPMESSMESDQPVLLVCVQLVWTLCALLAGYLLAGFLIPPAQTLISTVTYSSFETAIFLMSCLMMAMSFLWCLEKWNQAVVADIRPQTRTGLKPCSLTRQPHLPL